MTAKDDSAFVCMVFSSLYRILLWQMKIFERKLPRNAYAQMGREVGEATIEAKVQTELIDRRLTWLNLCRVRC